MKKVMIIAFSDLGRDPRVYRQIQYLKNDFQVIAVGTGDPGVEEVEYIQVDLAAERNSLIKRAWSGIKLLLGIYKKRYWQNEKMVQVRERLKNLEKDLIIANDIETLPLALAIAGDARVVFDAHEYSPGQFEHSLVWRLFFKRYASYLCKEYIPQVDAMMTVCHAIADKYERDTGVKPTVITNTPYYQELKPALQNKKKDRIKLIHHGGAMINRKLENMIDMMVYLDERFELNLMLVDATEGYIEKLKKLAKEKANIHFHDAVPMQKLSETLNQYDVGLYILEPSCSNQLYSLPNKLFEFIQARLAVAIGPSPEMAAIVREYDCGIVAADFSPQTMAACLLKLDHEKLVYYKRNSDRAARQLNAENNQATMLKLVNKVLKEV